MHFLKLQSGTRWEEPARFSATLACRRHCCCCCCCNRGQGQGGKINKQHGGGVQLIIHFHQSSQGLRFTLRWGQEEAAFELPEGKWIVSRPQWHGCLLLTATIMFIYCCCWLALFFLVLITKRYLCFAISAFFQRTFRFSSVKSIITQCFAFSPPLNPLLKV